MSRAESSAEPVIPRTIKPRRTQVDHRPVIAVDQEAGWVLLESGEVSHLSQLAQLLAGQPSSFIITLNGAALVNRLDRELSHVPNWQYRVTPLKRGIRKPDGQIGRTQIQGTVVNFLGWQRADKRAGLYHFPLDPFTFCGARGVVGMLPEPRVQVWDPITGEVLERLASLMAWGQDVRDWCVSHHLKVSPTNGGVAAQLLKDSRFWPEARRKVPRATNARMRPHLPGNHYRLMVDENRTYQAYYLDMSSSHHTIAADLRFPHPDKLRARGLFKDVPVESDVTVPEGRPWLVPAMPGFAKLLESHGLLYCQVSTRKLPDSLFPLPYVRAPGVKMAWVYTNELATLHQLGVTIDFIQAAWTAWDIDTGLNRYARWALQETQQATQEAKAWLKPTLLATYGILATRPRVMETGYRLAERGIPRRYPAGSGMLQVRAMVADTESETQITNVLYRGMIEAEQRVRALHCARLLTGHGCHVLAVYADSVFVDSSTPLPFLPEGWRVEAELDNLSFMSSTSFTSAQVTRLPGMARDSMARVRRLEQMRRLAKTS